MYLCCTHCAENADVPYRDNFVFFLAKYYPTTGWYIRGGEELKAKDGTAVTFVNAVNQWFTEHQHGGMYGEYIYTIFESVLGDPVTTEKRQILAGVHAAMQNVGKDKA